MLGNEQNKHESLKDCGKIRGDAILLSRRICESLGNGRKANVIENDTK